jgi:prophage DNA circulation protein
MSMPFIYIASFRGIPFRIETAETVFGRRNQLHEYPMRDVPYGEDLGKKAREYSINAYVIGTGYAALRTLLINAIEKNKNPGQLIHPTLGMKTVIPKECRHIYNNQDGGIEYFQLTFVEAGANLFPDVLSDTIGLFTIARGDSLKSLVSRFVVNFSIAKAPELVRAAAASVGRSVSTQVLSSSRLGVMNTDNYAGFLSINQTYQRDMNRLTAEPENYGNAIAGLVTGLTELYTNPMDAFEAQKSLSEFGNDFLAIDEITLNRKREARNRHEIVTLVKGCAVIEMANAISQMTFFSKDDALAMRDIFSERMEEQMTQVANAGNDEHYIALANVRIKILDDINQRALTLSRLTEVPILDSLPALVFAYNRYDNAARDQEIVERNRIRNPVFLPPHTQIQVLQ